MVDDRRELQDAPDAEATEISDCESTSCAVAEHPCDAAPPADSPAESRFEGCADDEYIPPRDANCAPDAGVEPTAAVEPAEVVNSACASDSEPICADGVATPVDMSQTPDAVCDAAGPCSDAGDCCDGACDAPAQSTMSFSTGEDLDEVAVVARSTDSPTDCGAESCGGEIVAAGQCDEPAATPQCEVVEITDSSDCGGCDSGCSGQCAREAVQDQQVEACARESDSTPTPCETAASCGECEATPVREKCSTPQPACEGSKSGAASRNRCEIDETRFVMDEPRRRLDPPSVAPRNDAAPTSGLKRYFRPAPAPAASAFQPEPRAAAPKPEPKRTPARRVDPDMDAALDLGLEAGSPPPRATPEPARPAKVESAAEGKKTNKLIDGLFGVLRKGKKPKGG
ncbi:MAG: hypothetical protein SF069_16150 [Phycisphaerae bacterium]|nr:hypothetical protein [Phycisphaerae bacterium]